MTGWRRQLGRQRGLPNNWSNQHLWLLRRTVDLVRHLPLNELLDWTHPSSRGHALLLTFLHLHGDLLANESPPLVVVHFYAKGDGKKELGRKFLKN